MKRNREFPTSFQIPSDDEKAEIEPGDKVKAMFEMRDWGERMWLEVVNVRRRQLVCKLSNHPVAIPRLDCGKRIRVRPRQVIDIKWHDVDYTEMDKADAERIAAYPSPFPPELMTMRCCGCHTCEAWRRDDPSAA